MNSFWKLYWIWASEQNRPGERRDGINNYPFYKWDSSCSSNTERDRRAAILLARIVIPVCDDVQMGWCDSADGGRDFRVFWEGMEGPYNTRQVWTGWRPVFPRLANQAVTPKTFERIIFQLEDEIRHYGRLRLAA